MAIVRMLAAAAIGTAMLAAPAAYSPLGMCQYAYEHQQWQRTITGCTLVINLAYPAAQKAFAYAARAEAETEEWSLEEASADAAAALKLDAKSVSAIFAQARVHRIYGQFDEAATEIERAVQLRPGSARYRLEQALLFLERADNNKARAGFDEAIRLDPSFGEAYFERGKFEQAQGDDSGAVADYARSVKYQPHEENRWLRFNVAAMESGDPATAKRAIDAAVAAKPDDLILHAIRGKLLLDREDYDAAIGDFDVVLHTVPRWIDVKVARIYALTRRAYRDGNVGDARRAVSEGQEGVILCPHTCTYYALALAHRALGDLGVDRQANYAAAVAAINQAIRLLPHQLPYRVLKAELLEQRETMSEAAAAYKEAMDVASDQHDAVSHELLEAAWHRAERASAHN